MFINNKYSKWYNLLIAKAQGRENDGYTEEHHIVPRSIGGSNEKENLVRLTAREHLVAHLLLTKCTTGLDYHKMLHAMNAMLFYRNSDRAHVKVTSRIYEYLRKKRSEHLSICNSGKGNPFYGKTHTKESRAKIGRAKTDEQKKRHSSLMKGRNLGRVPHNKGKTFVEMYGDRAAEMREKVKNVGPANGFYGKQHSEEQREKKRQEKLSAPKKECPHCGKYVDPMNFVRWHDNNCKMKDNK